VTDDAAISEVAAWLRDARRAVALTGAGISTDSGIPDFRGPQGIWTLDPSAERMSNIGYYVADPAVRREAWRRRLEHPAWTARPGPGHLALAEMEREGKLHAVITQNIDGLHQAAGSAPERVIEIHGTMRDSVCLACGDRRPMDLTLDRVLAGEDDPPCLACGGILKSATVSFGQNLDADDLARAETEADTADVLLAVGTSLTVYPVAWLPERTLAAGGRVAILNAEPTPLDGRAHVLLRGQIAELLPALARALIGR
jgi:NAD-dependent deacetylase